jgi:DNA-binding MarR family transcriptional regulator
VATSTLLIARLARASGARLGRELDGVGLRRREFAVLDQLAEAGPVSQLGLGQALHIHPSNLVALLDGLEARGLIRRPRDPGDRRRYLLELSPKGRLALDRAAGAAGEIERELLAPLAPGERRQLKALLERVAAEACCAPGDRSHRR